MKFSGYVCCVSLPDTRGWTNRQTDTTKLVTECPCERARSWYWLYPTTAWFSHISLSFETVCPNKPSNSDGLFEINFHSFTSYNMSLFFWQHIYLRTIIFELTILKVIRESNLQQNVRIAENIFENLKQIKFSLFAWRKRIDVEELQLHSFLKSALGESEKSNSPHTRFSFDERNPPPHTFFVGGWAGPRKLIMIRLMCLN